MRSALQSYGPQVEKESFGSLWMFGRLANISGEILAKRRGCESTWFGFEPAVVNGWPIDMVKVQNETFVYEPLGISAVRKPLKVVERHRFWEGLDGLLAWRHEAPFDMEW